jgi:hypothetical protein
MKVYNKCYTMRWLYKVYIFSMSKELGRPVTYIIYPLCLLNKILLIVEHKIILSYVHVYHWLITLDPLSKFHFIYFRPLFFRLGTISRFSWNGTTVSHWSSVWTHLRMFLNSKFHHFRVKCWILLKPVLRGMDGKLYFPIPSMNRLNQTEPATFSILLCWTFFRDSVFLYFIFLANLFLFVWLGFPSRRHSICPALLMEETLVALPCIIAGTDWDLSRATDVL